MTNNALSHKDANQYTDSALLTGKVSDCEKCASQF